MASANASIKFEKYVKKFVGSPYVWRGAGEKLTKNNYESFIDKNETSDRNKKRAKDFCKKLFDAGVKEMTVFDCSGYISKALMAAGLRTWRANCDYLWDKCVRVKHPRDFTLLFRTSITDPEDETHIGVYLNGYQYHAKGRDVGVVREPFVEGFWDKFGDYDGLYPLLNPSYSIGTKIKSPMYGKKEVKILKKLLKANGYGLNLDENNGNYLQKTKDAVLQFQRDYFFDESEADGIVGKKTVEALGGKWDGK